MQRRSFASAELGDEELSEGEGGEGVDVGGQGVEEGGGRWGGEERGLECRWEGEGDGGEAGDGDGGWKDEGEDHVAARGFLPEIGRAHV